MLHFTHFFFFWHLFKFQFSNSMRLFDLKFLKYIWYIYINKETQIHPIHLHKYRNSNQMWKVFQELLHTGSWRTSPYRILKNSSPYRILKNSSPYRILKNSPPYRILKSSSPYRILKNNPVLICLDEKKFEKN